MQNQKRDELLLSGTWWARGRTAFSENPETSK
jgi:hypothetical protein